MTHQLQYLHDVKHIIIMHEGKIHIQGSYDYIKSTENDFSSFLQSFTNESENADSKDVKVRRTKVQCGMQKY